MTKFRNPSKLKVIIYVKAIAFAVNFKSYWLISAKKLSKFEAFSSILLNRTENVLFVFEILLLADLKPLLCNLQLLSISDMV